MSAPRDLLAIEPAELDIQYYAPSDWFPVFTCTKLNPDGSVLGLYDFTGATAKMQVRDAPGAAVRDELSTANTRLVLGGALGTLQMKFPRTTGALYDFRSSSYDLLVTDSTGNEIPFFRGAFIVERGLTT